MMLFPFLQISKPATVPDRFTVCFPFTHVQEAEDTSNWYDPKNYSVDPVPTFNGIEESEYNTWRTQHGLKTRNVELMTEPEGLAIYRANYWLPHCPALPAGLDLQFFDSAVNEGPVEAVKLLQRALGGLTVDGVLGPQTAAAVRVSPEIIKAFTAQRIAVYRETKDFSLYGGDWMRRANEIGDEALKMVTT